MKKLINILIVLVSFYFVIAVSSCSKSGQERNPIKIGMNDWSGYDPFILADKKEFFGKHNELVEIKEFVSTTEVIKALKNEEIHGACLTLDEVFSLTESGFNGKIVLVLDYSMGGDMLIGQKEVKSITELEGKIIGYEGTVVGEFLLNRALQMNYIKRSFVKLIDVPKNDWLSAFKEKRVDALVCFNPIATSLLNKEEGNLLFSSTEIPFEIIDVLFFSDSYYDNNKTAITSILKSWFDALSYLDTNRENAVEVLSSAKKINPDEYKKLLKGIILPNLKVNKVVFDSKSDKNIYKYSQVIVNFMISKGLISKRINTENLFQQEILFEIDE